MKKLQRSMALVLALLLALSAIGVAAFADTTQAATAIDTARKGSITVTKYAYNGNGNAGDGTAPGNIPDDAKPLEGVTFTAYRVKNAEEVLNYYDGKTTDKVTVASFLDDGKIKQEYAAGGKEAVTGENGIARFTNLDVGMYVIVETASPENVTHPVAPFLISIPMTNPDGSGWMYDVNVYPKNSTSDGDITIVKQDKNGNPLENVTFKLEKRTAENTWTTVEETLTTGANGEIALKDQPHGTYRITETGTQEGFILDGRPISFTVSENNTITCNDNRATVKVMGDGSEKLTITITNEKPEITKTVTSDPDAAGVGETVNYQLSVYVPKNITDLATFTITDAPENLHVAVDTITVKQGETTVGADLYTAQPQGEGFVLKFNPATMADMAGKTLTLAYAATVLPGAATENKANNTATLTYTDKIDTDSTHDIEDDEPVYNFRLNITKYLDSENGALADGVVFELLDTNGKAILFNKNAETGMYVKSDNPGAGATALTTTNGKLAVSGLAAGSYKLKEIKTVQGYNLLSKPIDIELKKGADNSYTISQTVVNKKGFDLPRTGGMGTLLFITIGGVLVLGGVWLITAPGKKRKA